MDDLLPKPVPTTVALNPMTWVIVILQKEAEIRTVNVLIMQKFPISRLEFSSFNI